MWNGFGSTPECASRSRLCVDVIVAQEDTNPNAAPDWSAAPLRKQAAVALVFLVVFLLVDGYAGPAEQWDGAPTWYLPVGLSVALMLWGGRRYSIVVFVAALIAARVNYHRPILSWCGLRECWRFTRHILWERNCCEIAGRSKQGWTG